MNKFVPIARIVLGLIFLVFGINGFLNFLPAPELNEDAGNFIGALVGSGYFWGFLKLTEIACGVALLVGRFVPLALTVLAPVVLNIVLFHGFLDPAGLLGPGTLTLALGLFLAWAYRGHFAAVLSAGAKPTAK